MMRKGLRTIGLYVGGLAIGLSLTVFAFFTRENIEHEKSHEEMDLMKLGVINKSGEWVSKPNNMGMEEIEKKYGLEDSAYESLGNKKLESLGLRAFPFHDGLAIARIGDKWGVVNEYGKVIVNPIFENYDRLEKHRDGNLILRYSDGLALIKIDGKFGFLDVNGNVVIEPKFDDADAFSDGLAYVRIGFRRGYIDHAGDFKLEPNHAGNYDFSDGLAGFNDGKKAGYLDKSGNVVIKPRFDMVGKFKNGKALVGVCD
ncbi:MAG: WG repeat-containing protein [Candidatus Melainabacteria bacterium]|nr:MAG: WG repeat-containing protein [Candidatus Melainabacteria bacterium]